MKEKIVVISLGGSLIVPQEGIDVKFLKFFCQTIEKLIKAGYKFILVCGGGKTAREYQRAARAITHATGEELDWLGIEATKLNAELIKTSFGRLAHHRLVDNPTQKLNFKEAILVAAGWRPGCSTDYDAVLLARAYGARRVINLTNIDYLHNKNPLIYKDAKKIKEIDWAGFRKIVGARWAPGANLPFDPVASRKAERLGLGLILANGRRMKNLEKIIKGEKFIGSRVY